MNAEKGKRKTIRGILAESITELLHSSFPSGIISCGKPWGRLRFRIMKKENNNPSLALSSDAVGYPDGAAHGCPVLWVLLISLPSSGSLRNRPGEEAGGQGV